MFYVFKVFHKFLVFLTASIQLHFRKMALDKFSVMCLVFQLAYLVADIFGNMLQMEHSALVLGNS